MEQESFWWTGGRLGEWLALWLRAVFLNHIATNGICTKEAFPGVTVTVTTIRAF